MENGKNKYDETVSTSREESLLKALAIFEEERNKVEKPTIIRPDINSKRVILLSLLRLILLAGLIVLAYVANSLWGVPLWAGWLGVLAVFIVMVAVSGKRACIKCILLYQKHAPERVRASCVFEPSCSNYTMIAIEKYGVIKGIWKGIGRLRRCHSPNGGVDNP